MGDSGTIRVVVVLDSELAQAGLEILLNREPDIEIVGKLTMEQVPSRR